MAKIISKLRKPKIHLVGEVWNQGDSTFNEQVDDTPQYPQSGNNIIVAVNKDQVPIFYNWVRIIITCNPAYPKHPSYRENTPYQGRPVASQRTSAPRVGVLVGEVSETYYSVGGKDPKKGASYLYKYLDMNDTTTNDTSQLGFVMSMDKSKGENIILKAKTFYRGNESDVVLARFRLIRSAVRANNREFDHGNPLL